jgi:hypothetical protein
MSTKEVARFEDKYGEEKVIHKTRTGLRVKRTNLTPALAMNQAVSKMIGRRIRLARKEKGWTMQELALRVGMGTGNPKDRIWAIENGTRNEGVRMGTLYALAHALGVEATDFMPPVEDVAREAGVQNVNLTINGIHS